MVQLSGFLKLSNVFTIKSKIWKHGLKVEILKQTFNSQNWLTCKYIIIIYNKLGHPAEEKWEYSKLSGKSCYLDLTPNSRNLFTRKCVAARGEN